MRLAARRLPASPPRSRTGLSLTLAWSLATAVALAPASVSLAQPPAAPIIVEVAGHPLPPAFVARAVERAVRWAMPDEEIVVSLLGQPPDVSLSGEVTLDVRVEVARPDGTRAFWLVPVTVRPTSEPCQIASLLFVSNSPETLRWSTGLFRGTLRRGEVVRLLHHHRNGGDGRRLVLSVRVANPSSRPVRLGLNDARGGPAADELFTGHAAAARWLRQYWACAAQLVDVPANSTRTIDRLTLPPGQVGSGIVQAWVNSGERVVLDVQARLERDGDPAQESFLINRDTNHARGTFPSPSREVSVEHEAGRFQMVTVGGPDPLTDPASGRSLRGNYGVIYNVRGAIVNRDDGTQRVGVRVRADGGPAGGTFLVNGSVIEAPIFRAGEVKELTAITLAPGERRPFFLSTMPQAGSAYPVRLILAP